MDSINIIIFPDEPTAVACVALIDSMSGFPSAAAQTWATPCPMGDGRYWIIAPPFAVPGHALTVYEGNPQDLIP